MSEDDLGEKQQKVEVRPPELDTMAEMFAVAGEKLEMVADEAIALVKLFVTNPKLKRRERNSSVLKMSKRDSIESSMGSTSPCDRPGTWEYLPTPEPQPPCRRSDRAPGRTRWIPPAVLDTGNTELLVSLCRSATDRDEPKAPLLHRLHQLLINKFERFGADTYLSAEWIVHGG